MQEEVSFRKLQSLREEILQLGMYLGGFKPLRKGSNKEALDLLWNSRILAFEESGEFADTRAYLRTLYRRWEAVRGILAERYIYLAKQMARRFSHTRVDRQDFIQEASKGLLRAIDTYDVEYGVPFDAFARIWIHKYLSHMVFECGLIRMPVSYQTQCTGEDQFRQPLSYEWVIDGIVDANADSPMEIHMRESMDKYLNKCLSSLNAIQRKVVSLRYLSDENRLVPLEEVGRKLKCSRESARTNEVRGLRRLKNLVCR